jgi:hypothetical protein
MTATITTATETTVFDSNSDYDKKLKLVTAGLQNYHTALLNKQSKQNALAIIDYLLTLNRD